MLGNESNTSNRSRLNDSAGPPRELLEPTGSGSGPRARKRRIDEDEDATDSQALEVAIRSVKAIADDLSTHSKEASVGLVGFPGTLDLLQSLERGVTQIAVLYRPTPENDSKLDDIDSLGSSIWNLSINMKRENGPPARSQTRTIIAEREKIRGRVLRGQ